MSLSSLYPPQETPSRLLTVRRQSVLHRLWRESRLSVIGGIGFVFFLILALVGPLLTPYNPVEGNFSERLHTASVAHPFGTDNFGRDILSRVIYGTRNMFILTGGATLLAVGIGMLFGLMIGYAGGLVDELVMRIFDSLLALPAFLLALLLLGALGPSRITVLIATVVLYVPIVTRVVRSVVLDVKTKAYIEAAEVQGASRWHILFREILPAVLPALTVEAALRFSYAIFLVASLGFLGIGVARPEPDWGLMVSEAREWYALAPWIMFYPAAAIVLLVVSINLMTDGLRRLFQFSAATP